jgi:hypothetical protein
MENENQDLGKVTIEEPVSNADIMAQLMADYDEEATTNTVVTPETEVEADDNEELEEITEADGTNHIEQVEVEEETPVVEVETKTQPTVQSSKTNEAFKQMRQEVETYKAQAQQNANYASVIKEIAQANGITPDELIQNYNDRKAAQEAEKQGIPVEVYKKLNALEAEVQVLRTKPIMEKFDSQINSLVSKYNLTDTDVSAFYQQANENGFDLTKVKDIEKVYEFFNVDKVLNKKEQERLEQKEKIKKQAPLPPTTTTAVEVDEDAEIEAMLKKRGAWNG